MEYNIEYTGKKIKELLKERNINQKGLADIIGTSATNISKWLNNTMIPIDALVKIADYFGVTVDELIHDKNDKTSSKQKIDVSFEGIVRFFAEFAKEYGLDIYSYDTEKYVNGQGVGISFEYDELPFERDSTWLKNEYMCNFLKEFSSVLAVKTDNDVLYKSIIDMWADNQIEVANKKYREYLELVHEEGCKDIANTIVEMRKTDKEE